MNLNHYEWYAKICKYLKLKTEDEYDEKLEEWGDLATKKEHYISTINSVYDKPNTSYFEQYIDYIVHNIFYLLAKFIQANSYLLKNSVIYSDKKLAFYTKSTFYIIAKPCKNLPIH
ncbi:hypothetical protein RclHR1_01360017 [Rhizophagus clarus]|nr:hypothetical protein RclHR1_01360017 [Rhizophagus clarus]